MRVREDGPLAIHAELLIEGQPPAYRATLCRCGASKNKPYCDSSHIAAGFRATGEPATKESQPLAARGGQLKLTPAKDGPLLLEGALELVFREPKKPCSFAPAGSPTTLPIVPPLFSFPNRRNGRYLPARLKLPNTEVESGRDGNPQNVWHQQHCRGPAYLPERYSRGNNEEPQHHDIKQGQIDPA